MRHIQNNSMVRHHLNSYNDLAYIFIPKFAITFYMCYSSIHVIHQITYFHRHLKQKCKFYHVYIFQFSFILCNLSFAHVFSFHSFILDQFDILCAISFHLFVLVPFPSMSLLVFHSISFLMSFFVSFQENTLSNAPFRMWRD